MKILTHRGMWKINKKTNTLKVFLKLFGSGFRIETDIRYYKDKLVISHDIPNEQFLSLK